MSGYRIEIRHIASTVVNRPMVEVTPFGLYPYDLRGNAYMFDKVDYARKYARRLGKEIGFWVHDYTNMKGDKPSYY